MYTEVLSQIEGVGALVGARLANAIQDIRRFPTEAKLMAYLGVHVRDGKFPRKCRGEVANWHNEGRQAFYLLSEQWNRRQGSYWGQYLLRMKANLRQRHPDVVVENGKKRYTNGHIHKMALWRTMTRCCRHIFRELLKLERERVSAAEETGENVCAKQQGQ